MPKQVVTTYSCDVDPLQECTAEVRVRVMNKGEEKRYCTVHAIEEISRVVGSGEGFSVSVSDCDHRDVEAVAEPQYDCCKVEGCKSFGRRQRNLSAHMRKYHGVFVKGERAKKSIEGQGSLISSPSQSEDPTL